MGRLILNEPSEKNKNCVILIFVEGTIVGPRSWIGFFNIKKYAPIKNSIVKISNWEKQGAEIVYLTSRKRRSSTEFIRSILFKNKFAGTFLYYRTNQEQYKDIIEAVQPDVLIEDNCRSIGGAWQMCITHVEKKLRSKITSVVVKEFGGLDHLPDKLSDLMDLHKKTEEQID